MIVERFEVGVFAENCYLVACEQTSAAVVIDPGDEVDRIASKVKAMRLNVESILLTHAHLDHVKEVNAFKARHDVPVLMHRDDQFLLDNLPAQAAAFGLTTSGVPKIDGFLAEGDEVNVGDICFQVLHTPGHSPGSVSFVTGREAFVGDVLFAGSVGRTDLPGGSFDVLLRSIRSKLLPLGDEMMIYPGHGPATSIGQERRFNPFLKNSN